jgi:hypothetical protein
MIEIYNDWILVSSIGLMFAFLFIFEPYGWLMEKCYTSNHLTAYCVSPFGVGLYSIQL